ncbi:MAG: hypothetical protein IKV82_07770 [Akkermansia sp.]|nr:hypothetical protein [Akkermansia sp.]
MKKTLFLASLLAACFSSAYGDNSTTTGNTYTVLDGAFCNEANHVTYDGLGTFSVLSSATTEIDVTISLSALDTYLATNDYTSSGFVTWTYNVSSGLNSWGLNDTKTGIIGSWDGGTNGNVTTYDELKKYAVGDTLTLTITNDPKKAASVNDGIYVYATSENGEAVTVWSSGGLYNSYATNTTAYTVNTNYVTSVTIKTESTLDTSTWEPPVVLKPFVPTRTDDTSLGRVMCVGDSITHGISDATWRWQLFKLLTDNGIEHEIEGPLKGFDARYGFKQTGTVISEGLTKNSLTASYGKQEFNNVHLAQSSGRAHELVNDSNTRYSGFSTEEAARQYNANTYIMMIGTNDLLSDTNNDFKTQSQGGSERINPEEYAPYMQKLLGGEVTYDAESNSYSWNGTLGGNMLTAVNDMLNEESDKLYLMNIPCWGDHGNNNLEKNHYAVQEYNRLLEQWVDTYNQQYGNEAYSQPVKLVNVNEGLEDLTSSLSFKGHNDFFRAPGSGNSSDGLHPNEQGSLIIAGNLAKAMGIGGRTAGLARSDKDSAPSIWHSATVGTDGTVAAGKSLSVAENIFTQDGGYSVDFFASFGNGATDGWQTAVDAGMNITIGDGINSGSLSLSEGYIMWGGKVLYCQDTSNFTDNLRVVWHNGNAEDNVLSGYYVWLGDMLIGQGLSANAAGSALNGITVSASGAAGSVTDLSWANAAYAPTTTLITSAEHAYRVAQTAGNAKLVVTSGVSYEGITPVNASGGKVMVTSGTADATYTSILSSDNAATTETPAWCAMVNTAFSNDINVQFTGNISATLIGAMNNGSGDGAGKLVLDIAAGSKIGDDGAYGTGNGATGVKAAIAGLFGHKGGSGKANEFNVYINGGELSNNVVGGSISGGGSLDSVLIAMNSGKIIGNIYGGSNNEGGDSSNDDVKNIANAVVGKAQIIINGGEVTGDIVAGGSAGTIGNVDVLITDGIIGGDIIKGNAKRSPNASTNVTVIGNKASIGGDIAADTVTLQDVATSDSATGFDKYSNNITAEKLVLNNVQTDLGASINVSEIVVSNSDTSLIMGDIATLESLTLDAGATFGVFKAAESRAAESNSETTLTLTTLTVGKGATLNANIVLGKDSTLRLEDCLTMGSSVALATDMTIDLSADLLTLLYQGETIDIFASVDSLTLDGINIDKDTITEVNFTVDNMVQTFDMAYSNVGTVSITLIPEPTTTTLSLLALAGLMVRRRRH